MIDVERIKAIVVDCLTDSKLFAASVTVSKSNQIAVLLDGEGGVLVTDCVKVSRAIEGSLNRDEEDFELEVCSFGVGTPLLLPRQYQINVGRNAHVVLVDGKILNGTITQANEQSFTLTTPASGKKKPSETFEVLYENCQQTQITVSFK